jgi:hypothetical protein
MDLKEREWKVVDWIHVAKDRDHLWAFVKRVMNFRVLLKEANLLTI